MPTFGDILERGRAGRPFRYGISSLTVFPELKPAQYVRHLFSASEGILQWREKDLSPGEARPLIQLSVRLARETGTLFLVNSYLELALQEGAHGVHLTSVQDEEPVVRMVHRSHPGFIVGKSVHSIHRAVEASRAGVDYLLLAPIFHPLSKQSASRPLGLEGLRTCCQIVGIPVFALGGVTPDNEREVIEAGAAGIAGISWIAGKIREQIPVS